MKNRIGKTATSNTDPPGDAKGVQENPEPNQSPQFAKPGKKRCAMEAVDLFTLNRLNTGK